MRFRSGKVMLDKHTETRWIYINGEMVYRPVTFVPELLSFLNYALNIWLNFREVFREKQDILRRIGQEIKEERSFRIDINQQGFTVYIKDAVDPYEDFPNKIMAEVSSTEGEKGTQITYRPDFGMLNIIHLDDDMIGLMQKLVIDHAINVDVYGSVVLNGHKVITGTLLAHDGMRTNGIWNINHFVDAKYAGGPNSIHCTLIIAEGLSGLETARAGVNFGNGNHLYGIYALTGKVINAKGAKAAQAWNNKHVLNLMEILGLQKGKEYISNEGLRYGQIMFMTDEDHDGSHIKGLIINLFHSFWPSLLQVPFFFIEFRTPIIKVISKDAIHHSFYSMKDFNDWSKNGCLDQYTIKYYKGLGTCTKEEALENFSIMKIRCFQWNGESDDKAIRLAFDKAAVSARKEWVLERCVQSYSLHNHEKWLVSFSEFINSDVIDFFVADLKRSIPSAIDGLKTTQRKLLFSSLEGNLVKSMKVPSLSATALNRTCYHHGEESMCSTLIRMAQDHVGSKNLNLFQPDANFGSRDLGGKDHAPTRYLLTRLAPIARMLFPKEDDSVLSYLRVQGTLVEPNYYVPIIPLILVNGCLGVGVGLNSFIPTFHPKDVIKNTMHLLKDEKLEEMIPWYRGFTGEIVMKSDSSYIVRGVIRKIDDTTLLISELPIGKWTLKYVEYLDKMVAKGEIESYNNQSDCKSINIGVKCSTEKMRAVSNEDLLRIFKLTQTKEMKHMNLLNADSLLTTYNSPQEILQDHFKVRLAMYEKRKAALLNALEIKLMKLQNKTKFVSAKVDLYMLTNAQIVQKLEEEGFSRFPVGEDGDFNEELNGYEYLVNMGQKFFSKVGFQELTDTRDKVNKEVDDLRHVDPKSLWLRELTVLDQELDSFQELDRSDSNQKQDESDSFPKLEKSGEALADEVERADIGKKASEVVKQRGSSSTTTTSCDL